MPMGGGHGREPHIFVGGPGLSVGGVGSRWQVGVGCRFNAFFFLGPSCQWGYRYGCGGLGRFGLWLRALLFCWTAITSFFFFWLTTINCAFGSFAFTISLVLLLEIGVFLILINLFMIWFKTWKFYMGPTLFGFFFYSGTLVSFFFSIHSFLCIRKHKLLLVELWKNLWGKSIAYMFMYHYYTRVPHDEIPVRASHSLNSHFLCQLS